MKNRKVRTQEVKSFLEELVWSRFSLPQLNKKLSDFFQEKIELYNTSEEREDNNDSDDKINTVENRTKYQPKKISFPFEVTSTDECPNQMILVSAIFFSFLPY